MVATRIQPKRSRSRVRSSSPWLDNQRKRIHHDRVRDVELMMNGRENGLFDVDTNEDNDTVDNGNRQMVNANQLYNSDDSLTNNRISDHDHPHHAQHPHQAAAAADAKQSGNSNNAQEEADSPLLPFTVNDHKGRAENLNLPMMLDDAGGDASNRVDRMQAEQILALHHGHQKLASQRRNHGMHSPLGSLVDQSGANDDDDDDGGRNNDENGAVDDEPGRALDDHNHNPLALPKGKVYFGVWAGQWPKIGSVAN